ncbi:MAG: phenylalanine--tRNA ligase beta subunit-related protein, partial [Patescibacteria group bacterium]
NSSIKSTTKTVVLFIQTYNPALIRRTLMTLAHRTEAGSLFEKGLDSELVLPTVLKGIELMKELTGGQVASQLYDLYHQPYKPYTVSVKRDKVDSYLSTRLSDKELKNILKPLGLASNITKDVITVTVPSFRQDITLDVDIIEEIARIYGYHHIATKLPGAEPPVVMPNSALAWEEEVKVRLRDWGYTELYTYSMISAELMDIFALDKTKAYKISNPLSNEWIYLRPSLWPSFLSSVKENLNYREGLRLFELANTYRFRPNELPNEYPILVVAWTGERFFEAKGLAEALFDLFGIPFPDPDPQQPLNWYDETRRLGLGKYGALGVLSPNLQHALGIKTPITVLDLLFPELIADRKLAHPYQPIPKHPPVVEDLAFVVPVHFQIGPLITALRAGHRLINTVSLLDTYNDTRTLRVIYLDPQKNLTNEDIVPVREKLIKLASEKFGVRLKTA